MAGISPKLPLVTDSADGAYLLNKTIVETTKQNLKNLVLTHPGERIMDPFFGVGIRAFLFEQDDEFLEESIKEAINSQVSTYLPHIEILDVSFGRNENQQVTNIDSHLLSMKIVYKILPFSAIEILEITP